jgi:hypothetical protein
MTWMLMLVGCSEKAVVVVDRREVDLVGLAGFQFQDRIPGPQAGQQEGLALGVGLGDRDLLVGFGTDGVFLDEGFRLGGEHFRGGLVDLVGKVLFAVDMPVDHHHEHDHGPDESNADPGPFLARDRLLPPQPL